MITTRFPFICKACTCCSLLLKAYIIKYGGLIELSVHDWGLMKAVFIHAYLMPNACQHQWHSDKENCVLTTATCDMTSQLNNKYIIHHWNKLAFYLQVCILNDLNSYFINMQTTDGSNSITINPKTGTWYKLKKKSLIWSVSNSPLQYREVMKCIKKSSKKCLPQQQDSACIHLVLQSALQGNTPHKLPSASHTQDLGSRSGHHDLLSLKQQKAQPVFIHTVYSNNDIQA